MTSLTVSFIFDHRQSNDGQGKKEGKKEIQNILREVHEAFKAFLDVLPLPSSFSIIWTL